MKKRGQQRGILFIIAMVSMVVMFIIGTMFLGSANQQYQDATRDVHALHAVTMADAGIAYIIWRQRYAANPISEAEILPLTTNLRTLNRNAPPAPAATLRMGPGEADQCAIWLAHHRLVNNTAGYQAVSTGHYRNYAQSVRAVLQGRIAIPDPGEGPSIFERFVAFAHTNLTIGNSAQVRGNLGANQQVTLDLSASGSVTGDLYSAGSITFNTHNAQVTGNVQYGTKLYQAQGKKEQEITDPTSYISGVATNDATTVPLPPINHADYLAWAQSYGETALYNSERLSSTAGCTAPILYVNSADATDFTLRITGDLTGPLTIFVRGEVRISGNVQLGSPEKPIVLISTGNIVCSGTPTIYGYVWSNKSFGGGTPNVYGAIACDTLGKFGSDVTLSHQTYSGITYEPPTIIERDWSVVSWELM